MHRICSGLLESYNDSTKNAGELVGSGRNFGYQLLYPTGFLMLSNASSQRDVAVRAIETIGRRQWARDSGYTRRSLVETAMSRYKAIIGDSMRSRTMGSQKVEATLACAIINRMAQLGMPDGYCIA